MIGATGSERGGGGGGEEGEGEGGWRGVLQVMQESCEVRFLVPHSEHRMQSYTAYIQQDSMPQLYLNVVRKGLT